MRMGPRWAPHLKGMNVNNKEVIAFENCHEKGNNGSYKKTCLDQLFFASQCKQSYADLKPSLICTVISDEDG